MSRINGLNGAWENPSQWRSYYADPTSSQTARLTTRDRGWLCLTHVSAGRRSESNPRTAPSRSFTTGSSLVPNATALIGTRRKNKAAAEIVPAVGSLSENEDGKK